MPLDIEQAIRNDSYKCVVAQAVQRTIPEAGKVMVDLQTIRFTLEDRRLQYLTPIEVAQYVVDFDAGDPIHPFKFSLYKPRVTRLNKSRVNPSAPKTKYGSRAHLSQGGARHAPETMAFVGARGDVTHEEVMSKKRTLPGGRRVRHYGVRMLRINRDRFAAEATAGEANGGG